MGQFLTKIETAVKDALESEVSKYQASATAEVNALIDAAEQRIKAYIDARIIEAFTKIS